MKKSRSKLTLNRETIAHLNDSRLADAAGAKTTSVCHSACATVCQCPSYQNTVCNSGCLPCGTQTDCIGTQAC